MKKFPLLFSAFIIALSPLNLHAADDPIADQLKRLNQAIVAAQSSSRTTSSKAQELDQETRVLKRDLIALAQEMQDREAVTTRLETQLAALQGDLARREVSAEQWNAQISQALTLFMRMSRVSPASLLFLSETPEDIAQGVVLSAAIIPDISQRALALNKDLAALATVRIDIEDKIKTLDKSERKLFENKQQMEALIARKQELLRSAKDKEQDANRRLANLVDKAQSMQDLINGLSRARAAPQREVATLEPAPSEEDSSQASLPPEELPAVRDSAVTPSPAPETTSPALERPDGIRPFPTKKGQLASPVSGKLVQKYGEDTPQGVQSRGVSLQARAQAQVIAPFDGKVAFAGSFLEYGLVIILEHDGGYHSVLAGMKTLSVDQNQWVLAGEPIGVLADKSSDGETPRLYVELRQNGKPVDPLEWLQIG